MILFALAPVAADTRIRDTAARRVDAARSDRAATLAAIDAAHGRAAS